MVDPVPLPDADEASQEPLRRSPRQARGARRVSLLLDAAAAVIAEGGLAAATAERIARQARTAKGSLYQFFPNSDAIVSALAVRYANELAMIYATAFGEAHDSRTVPELVDQVLLPLAGFHDRNPAFRHIFEAARQARDDDGTGRLVLRLRATVVERIEGLMATFFPTLRADERLRHARVVQAMGQALLYLRAESPLEERGPLLAATQQALVAYLSALAPTVRAPGSARSRSR